MTDAKDNAPEVFADLFGAEFRTILSIFHEGVIVADAGGTILYYNDAQGRIDDLPPREAIGRKIVDVYDLSEAQSTTMRCLHSGEPVVNQPIFYRTRLGRFANVVSNVYPIRRDGRLVGAVSFTKDYQMVEKIVSPPSTGRTPKTPGNGTRYAFGDIVGSSPGLLAAVKTAQLAAGSPSPVMIFGETGTGKEIIAQSIHNYGPGRRQRFIPINCAAIPENLLEAILFGTTRGAFTGAEDRPGLFEEAASGTIFLDEINAMSPSLQAKLLRVIQEKRIRRIGALAETPVDVKVISSLNEDPYRAVERRTLRQDLFYRLGVVVIAMPPLRERRGDLPALACRFVGRCNQAMKKAVADVSEEVMRLFQGYHWPGNVRELAHVIEGAMNLVGPGEAFIDTAHLPPHLRKPDGVQLQGPPASAPPTICPAAPEAGSPAPGAAPEHAPVENLVQARDMVEAAAIRRALLASGGNVARAARVLGLLSPQSLHYKLKKYGLNRKDFILSSDINKKN